MKYFTNSYLNDYSILKSSQIGFEFEFYSKITYPNTIEVFGRELDKRIVGIKEYHPNQKPTNEEWLLTPDLSGGYSMCELITSPLPYNEARIYLLKILNIIEKIGYTNERTGLHINISFTDPKVDIGKISAIKTVLQISEEKIYEAFPDRKDNIYCKSIKNIIPFKEYDFSDSTSNILNNSLFLHSSINKYYGINFTTISKGRLEFRYIGGADYQKKKDECLDLMDYFISTSYECITEPLSEGEIKVLRRILDKKISDYKFISDINNFYSKYPSISIEIDRSNQIEVVKSYYPSLYDKIYEVISNTKNLRDCKFNFDTCSGDFEVVGGEFEVIGLLEDYVFIDSIINKGDFLRGEFFGCQLDNVILNNCVISNNTTIKDSKMIETNAVKRSVIENSFFSNGYLDCEMISGVLKSASLGDNAEVGKEVKKLDNDPNFFNLKVEEIKPKDSNAYKK